MTILLVSKKRKEFSGFYNSSLKRSLFITAKFNGSLTIFKFFPRSDYITIQNELISFEHTDEPIKYIRAVRFDVFKYLDITTTVIKEIRFCRCKLLDPLQLNHQMGLEKKLLCKPCLCSCANGEVIYVHTVY